MSRILSSFLITGAFLGLVGSSFGQQPKSPFDPKAPFLKRYETFCMIRALYEANIPGISGDVLLDTMAKFFDHPDFADIPIESFRQWKRWEYTDRILSMSSKRPFDKALIRKSILRFALQAPGPAAAGFVAKMRKKDVEWVEETKELLELELMDKATLK